MALTKEDLLSIGQLMDNKLESISERLDKLEKGQSRLEQRMERRFDKVEANIKAIWHDIDIALDKTDEHVREFHSVG